MTSLVTAKYDSNKNQILDPNTNTGFAQIATDPLTGGTGIFTPSGVMSVTKSLQPQIEVITYTGTGSSLSFATSFQPDGVIILGSGRFPVFSHRAVWRGYTPLLGLAQPHITSGGVTFPASGNSITVGTNPNVNTAGETYKAIVFADNGSGLIRFGSYSGNGAAGRSIDNVGGQPEFVFAKRDNTYTSQMRFFMGAQGLQATAVTPTDNITGFNATGFTVSAANDVNQAVAAAGAGGEAYDYIAFMPSKYWKCFSYAASGSAQTVPLPFTASAAIIKSTDTVTPRDAIIYAGGVAKDVSAGVALSDAVTATSTGLSLGTNVGVNASGKIYNGIAFASTTSYVEPETKIVPAGLLVNSAASAGVLCTTANTGFDRAGSAFSMELYCYIDQTQATDQYLFTRSLNSINISYSLVWSTPNNIAFTGHETAGNKTIHATTIQPKTSPTHIVLTYDGTSKFRFAVDGRVVKVMDTAFAIDTVASSLMTIGGKNNSGSLSATGSANASKFYMARFYTAVLTDAQIMSRYKIAALGDASQTDVDPYEEWDMGRVVGSTVYASKSATNNGTIANCTVI